MKFIGGSFNSFNLVPRLYFREYSNVFRDFKEERFRSEIENVLIRGVDVAYVCEEYGVECSTDVVLMLSGKTT